MTDEQPDTPSTTPAAVATDLLVAIRSCARSATQTRDAGTALTCAEAAHRLAQAHMLLVAP
jgi:hypothetical protein